jgi:hypothetical protein
MAQVCGLHSLANCKVGCNNAKLLHRLWPTWPDVYMHALQCVVSATPYLVHYIACSRETTRVRDVMIPVTFLGLHGVSYYAQKKTM